MGNGISERLLGRVMFLKITLKERIYFSEVATWQFTRPTPPGALLV